MRREAAAATANAGACRLATRPGLLSPQRLDVVGDPRRGVGLIDGLPDIDWCPIDGGEVTIEEQRQVVEPFRMARYPITIAQFRAFVEDCFRDGKWHLPPGFEGEFPHEDPPRHRASGGSYGADSVSWYDATVFCHWLGTRLKAKIRLPTEAEWQLAATGGDPERVFPWGPDWDPQREPWRANTHESGLGRALPVGFYPLGALPGRPHGHGRNLREWCQDWYEEGQSRVLRGGSWYLVESAARSANRHWSHPSHRDSSIGFRVVCSSSS